MTRNQEQMQQKLEKLEKKRLAGEEKKTKFQKCQ